MHTCLISWVDVFESQFMTLCTGLFVIYVISRFGFEGWICILIASVPDLCILLTFIKCEGSCGSL